jgi:hypothetical protein
VKLSAHVVNQPATKPDPFRSSNAKDHSWVCGCGARGRFGTTRGVQYAAMLMHRHLASHFVLTPEYQAYCAKRPGEYVKLPTRVTFEVKDIQRPT